MSSIKQSDRFFGRNNQVVKQELSSRKCNCAMGVFRDTVEAYKTGLKRTRSSKYGNGQARRIAL